MTSAGEVFALDLEEREQRGRTRWLNRLWWFLSTVTMELFGSPSAGDFVVRRRDNGAEVVRVDAGSDESTGYLRQHLETQLDSMTPEAFVAEWSQDQGPGRG